MLEQNLILDIFYYLLATIVVVPVFKQLGLGSVLGYLVAGVAVGPYGLSVLNHNSQVNEISEIGIIFLLFVIGLELTPNRLKSLRKVILKEGSFQFFSASVIFMGLSYLYGLNLIESFVIGCSLSLSSTAFALYYLKDTDQLTKSYGQASFGVLLFQDIIIIPLLTIIPLMSAEGSETLASINLIQVLKNISIFGIAIVAAKKAITPIMAWIHKNQPQEIFTALLLAIVIGASLTLDYIGLSKALGAFLAGNFLSQSKFKSDILKFSIPLKSMLMGIFFLAFGLQINLEFINNNLLMVFGIASVILITKLSLIIFQGLVFSRDLQSSTKMGLILCQAGEFGLLTIALATQHQLVSTSVSTLLISSITISLFLAPLIAKITELSKREKPIAESNVIHIEDKIKNENNASLDQSTEKEAA